MKKAVILLSTTLVVMTIACLYFLYMWIDLSITHAYTNASYDSERQHCRLTTSLLTEEWHGISKQALLAKLKVLHQPTDEYFKMSILYPEYGELLITVDQENPDIIWLDNLKFEFQANKLNKIH